MLKKNQFIKLQIKCFCSNKKGATQNAWMAPFLYASMTLFCTRNQDFVFPALQLHFFCLVKID